MSFESLLAAATRDPARATALGLQALDERREEDALPLVTAAARGGGDPKLLHVLGLLHRSLGDLGPAIAAFDRALAAGPATPRLVHARAHAALEAGLDSVPWFLKARALAPTDGDIILGHAAALLAGGDGNAAYALLADMLRQHPGWLPGHEAYARLRYALEGPANCLAALDAAIAAVPRDPRLHQIKITILHRAGDGERARAAIAAAAALLGPGPMIVSATAMVATETGDLAEAGAAFAQLDPLETPELAIHWLRYLLRKRQPERVIAEAGKYGGARAAIMPYLSLARRLTGEADGGSELRGIKVIDFGEDWPLLAPLATALRALHVTSHQPVDQSVRGGTQTDGPLFSRVDPTIRAVRNQVMTEVASYMAALPLADGAAPVPRRPRFTGSWSVRLRDGGFHEPHVHDQGWLSSAFYVAVPDGCSSAAGSLTLGEPQPALGLGLEPLQVVEARPGRLVLFPSTMWHGTRPFQAGERLTLAFDMA